MPAKRSRPLEEYRRKRDFQRTPEPEPKTMASGSGKLFVVQKHRAQSLHYDFRLELDGALLSWAVPKGPSLDPAEKRLAVQTEDHPIEYGSFEGVIPEEEYGGGTVMLWDSGEWTPLMEPREAIAAGTLKFTVEGQKLRGAWTLVRIKEKGVPSKNWLLIKERDEEARSEGSFSIIDEEPFSAVSGRTIGEIAAAKDRVWTGGGARGAAKEGEALWRRGLYRRVDLGSGERRGAKKASIPEKLATMKPKAVDSVPEGDDWIHEILQIGKRVLCFLEERLVRLLSTGGEDWSFRLPEIARAISRLPIRNAVLDGVVLDGLNSEWERPSADTSGWRYSVFDLPYADGFDLRNVPLLERKRLLRALLEGAEAAIGYCDHVEGHGEMIVEHAKGLHAPGIVSKRAESKYIATGRQDWLANRFLESSGAEHARTKRPRASSEELEVTIAGVKLTHPGRILYPEERVSKRMLAEYYEAIASIMLRHVGRRPLSIYRCPGGVEKESFFQKQLGEVSSKHLRSTQAGDDPYVALDDVRGLITLAQWNVLEIHGWGCREEDIEHPDLMIFDLDPGPNVPWEQIVQGAKGLRLLLGELGLQSFVKTSGGKGLHVAVPLSGGQGWDEVKDFSARVARKIVQVAPKHFTVFMSKPERRGKVFIDYHRNHRGSTCVVPYSTRARPGAFVSTPLEWAEIDGPQPRFHIYQLLERLTTRSDPWEEVYQVEQGLAQEAIDWLRG